MNPQVTAALVAGLVSLLGVVAAVASARWTNKAARQRLLADATLARERLFAEAKLAREKLLADAEALRQNLLRDVLAKRMAAYAAIWKVVITYDLNWVLEGKRLDGSWSVEFLRELNVCNADRGAFFSEFVYKHFAEYRACLANIANGSRRGEEVSAQDVQRLNDLVLGTAQKPGLATALKDDLGSYLQNILKVGAPE
jgi:hypothetical protein